MTTGRMVFRVSLDPRGESAPGAANELAAHFVELVAALRSERADTVEPERLVKFAISAVPHAEYCGVTLIRPRTRPRTLAATGDVATAVDDLQYETGEGPCLDTSTLDDLLNVQDVGDDPRWPRFGPRCAAEVGIHSVLSLRLSLGRHDRAALNLYASPVSAFDELDIGTASIFAPFAAVSVQSTLRRTDAENFTAALTSSRQIGTAVGILMAQERLTSDQAFDLLRQASNHLNRRLHEIAAEVELTGALPEYERGAETPSHSQPSAPRRPPRAS